MSNEMKKCLFTNAVLATENKIEHTILRALGGRIRSRRVTSSEFNELSSVFDKSLADQYKIIMHALSPILPAEFDPGKLEVTLDGGIKAVRQRGITTLDRMVVIDRYSSGKPKNCYFPDDESLVKRIAKKQKLAIDYKSMSKQSLPGKIDHLGEILACSPQAEIAAIKCVLCSFDEICQDKYSDFVFTRDHSLACVRDFIRKSIESREQFVNIDLMDKFYLGVQVDKSIGINKTLRLFNYCRGPYEHIILITSNAATKTVDVIWDLLGVDTLGIRLTHSWTGPSFCGMLANSILPCKDYYSEIKLGEENPYLSLDRTRYKSFGNKTMLPKDLKEISYFLSEKKE